MVDQVKELYVFQRTPNWFFPRIEGEIPNWAKKFLATFPIVNNVIYWFIFVFVELVALTWLRKGVISK